MTALWNFFSREQTDLQYNPTLWTKRLPADDLLPLHVDLTTNRSTDYRRRIGNRLQVVSYGENEFVGEMDVFHSENAQSDSPIVVYIHGGWWQWFSKEQFSFLAEPFNKKGMKVYMPGYRLAQNWNNGQPMESIVKQMEYAVAHALMDAVNSETKDVFLIGHSAGGQLVTMLHDINWQKYGLAERIEEKIKSIYSLAGLFDLRFLLDSFVNDEINMTLESASAVSPQLQSWSKRQLCPIHLILPEFDTAEFFRQTKEFHNKLLDDEKVSHLKVMSNRDHLDLIENLVNEDDQLLNYILDDMEKSNNTN